MLSLPLVPPLFTVSLTGSALLPDEPLEIASASFEPDLATKPMKGMPQLEVHEVLKAVPLSVLLSTLIVD